MGSRRRRRLRRLAAAAYVLLLSAFVLLAADKITNLPNVGALLTRGSTTGQGYSSSYYSVQAGDTLDGIAARFHVSSIMLARMNSLTDTSVLRTGERLLVPSVYHPKQTRLLVVSTARHLGVDPAFALAVAWQESGLNENMRSGDGAVGVMQIEPGTAALAARQLGRALDPAVETDNVMAGVYWLGYLVRFYGGDEALAAAAYYEGQGNLAERGYLMGTHQYVADVLALRRSFLHG